MKLNKKINFKTETIDIIYKKYCLDSYEDHTINKMKEAGLSEKEIDNLFGNFLKFKKVMEDKIDIPNEFIPYFLMVDCENNRLLNVLYQLYEESKDKDYNRIFIKFILDYVKTDSSTKEDLTLEDTFKIINSLESDDSLKLSLINLYIGKEELFNKLVKIIDEVSLIFEDNFYFIKDDVEEAYITISDDGYIKQYLKNFLKIDKILKGDEEVSLLISFYNQIALSDSNGDYKLSLGYLVLKFSKVINSLSINEDKLINRLKVISDPTRFKILQILKQGSTFANDIAKTIGLTPATVNHHINILLNELLIIGDISDNKKTIYYSLQNDKIEELIDNIRKFLL